MRAPDEEYGPGCDCTELCEMGPTCPGGGLAGLPGTGCWRTDVTSMIDPLDDPEMCNTCGYYGKHSRSCKDQPTPAEKSIYDAWWTINGRELLRALDDAYCGNEPEMVYAELYANSRQEKP